MTRYFSQREIVEACSGGHMGMELSFVPHIAIPGQRGVVQAWSTDYGSENVATFRMVGRDGDVNVWVVDEILQPFFLRLLKRKEQERSEHTLALYSAWYDTVMQFHL